MKFLCLIFILMGASLSSANEAEPVIILEEMTPIIASAVFTCTEGAAKVTYLSDASLKVVTPGKTERIFGLLAIPMILTDAKFEADSGQKVPAGTVGIYIAAGLNDPGVLQLTYFKGLKSDDDSTALLAIDGEIHNLTTCVTH